MATGHNCNNASRLAGRDDQCGANDWTADVMGLRRRLALGVAVAAIVALTIFSWGAFVELSGAVIAPGLVVVDGNSKKIQHQQGGIVAEIPIRNGTRVAAGDVLIRLDDTQMRASLGIISSQLLELGGRKARLSAERDGDAKVTFPDELIAAGAEFSPIAAGENRLFEVRRTWSEGRKAQLVERIRQLEEEIKGSGVQHRAKVRELILIGSELSRVSDMYSRKLLPVTRVLAMQRDEARIDGESGTLVAQIARLKGQISETELQIGSLEQQRVSDAQKEVREIEGRISELQDKRIAAEDQLRRVVLKAPIDGVVHELAIHTVGGIAGAGEQLMLIVPTADVLSIEVRVPTHDIDHIKVGQPAVLRLPALNQRTTLEGRGVISRISPDASRESQSGQMFFTARIAPDADFLATPPGRKLVPGMPVEAFIETSPRSALTYLIKPLSDQFNRAFREL